MKKAFVCVGLGNGDEGKGQIVSNLALQYNDTHTVIRYCGGAQAAHNVVTRDGRHHTFAQFGSATFLPGVNTYHSKDVLLSPTAMLTEAAHLSELGVEDALDRTYINDRAPIISPYHKLMNQMKERARGANRHGSCGMGIGEIMMDVVEDKDWVIRAGDMLHEDILREKLEAIQHDKYCQAKETDGLLDYQEITGMWLDKEFLERWIIGCLLVAENARIVDGFVHERHLFNRDGTIIFEGSQGVLLDEWHGFHPYTTWSTTTTQWAEEMLFQNSYDGEVTKIGILRPYATRHGAGPLPTESENLTALLEEPHNKTGEWQGNFRFGHFDAVMSRYAIKCCHGIDELAITHMDEIEKMPSFCYADYYHYSGNKFPQYIHDLQYCDGNRDLDWREQVTNMIVDHYNPSFVCESSDADLVVETIAHELKVPVTMHSWGKEMGASVRCVREAVEV